MNVVTINIGGEWVKEQNKFNITAMNHMGKSEAEDNDDDIIEMEMNE